MPTPRAFGPLGLAFGIGRRQSGLPLGRCLQDIGRQLHVSLNDPHQHLAIFGTAAIGFKPMQQRQGVLRAQIDFFHILEELEVLKHDGLHPTDREIQNQASESGG
jgi:hypothetical protein